MSVFSKFGGKFDEIMVFFGVEGVSKTFKKAPISLKHNDIGYKEHVLGVLLE
jgi:hypothetical protein